MKRRLFLYIINLIVISLIWHPQEVFAVVQLQEQVVLVPTFPKCELPQGEIIVYYPQGVHGIPGNLQTHVGSDYVYELTEDTLTQCFCAIDSNGVQTNWWKVSSLTMPQIEGLITAGWTYIPNGGEWGLEEAPYLTSNRDYDCIEHEDGGDDDDDDDDNRGGQVLGVTTSGKVLGLAKTGNTIVLAVLLALGVLSTAGLVITSKKQK